MVQDVLTRIAGYDNVPRKKNKFVNFVTNSLALRDTTLVEKAWTIYEVAFKASAPETSETSAPVEDAKKSKTEHKPIKWSKLIKSALKRAGRELDMDALPDLVAKHRFTASARSLLVLHHLITQNSRNSEKERNLSSFSLFPEFWIYLITKSIHVQKSDQNVVIDMTNDQVIDNRTHPLEHQARLHVHVELISKSTNCGSLESTMRLSLFLTLLLATFVVSCIGFSSAENVADNGVRRLRQAVEVEEERGIGDALAGAVTSIKAKFTTNSGKLVEGLKTTAQLSDDQAAKLAKILTNPEKARKAFLVSDDEVARMSTIIKQANAEAGVADDQVASVAKVFAAAQKSAKASDEQVIAIAKMLANAKKVEAAAKASDDEVRKVSEMFKIATGRASGAAKYTDDEVAKLSKGLAEAQKGAALSDNQVAKIVKTFTEAKVVTSLSKKQVAKLAAQLAPVAEKDPKSWSTLKKVIVATLGVTGGAAVIYGVVKLTSSPASTASSAAA